MPAEQLTDARIFKYHFDVPIGRDSKSVWSLMTNAINDWWMPDFRALGENSVVTLDAKTGGVLVEKGPDDESLEWYRVQMCTPGKSLHMTGYMAPDWGGPTITMLKLALEPDGDHTILKVSDALLGNVTEAGAKSAESGWNTLFRDGLKAHAER